MIYLSDSFYVSALPTEASGGVTQNDVDWYALFAQGGAIEDAFGNVEPLYGDLGPNRPRIGYNNLIVPSSLTADFETPDKPARNLGNVSTAERWQTASGEEASEQHVYFSTQALGASDYLGIARHNLGSLGVSYVLQGRSGADNFQVIDLGGAVVESDIAIAAIDGDFQFLLAVDGGSYRLISVTYAAASNVTWTTLLADLNAELTGCTAALVDGNLRLTSDLASPAGSIHIKSVNGINCFATYLTAYLGLSTAVGWTDAFAPRQAVNDHAIFYQFDPVAGETWRLKLIPPAGTTSGMFIAVLFVGRALILPRSFYVDHTPVLLARKTRVGTRRSENGQFLGRVLVASWLETEFSIQNLGPLFTRVHLDPWCVHARTLPFFIAWRPQQYPDECAFCWATNDLRPANARANGMMQLQVSLEAIAV